MEKIWSSSYNGQQTNILTGSAVLDNGAPNTFYGNSKLKCRVFPFIRGAFSGLTIKRLGGGWELQQYRSRSQHSNMTVKLSRSCQVKF